nr:hypothetical protein [Tanacetum cinerariifolium]
MMSFLSVVVTSCFPTTNNQMRNSSNSRQQATINDGRVTLQPVQGKQISFATGTSRTYTLAASGSNSGKQRIVICYNCKGEGLMSKQCTKPKRKRDDTWFKDKVLLVQAQANGQILPEEELAFLADTGIPKALHSRFHEAYKLHSSTNSTTTPPFTSTNELIRDRNPINTEPTTAKPLYHRMPTLLSCHRKSSSDRRRKRGRCQEFRQPPLDAASLEKVAAFAKPLRAPIIKAQQQEPKLYNGDVIKNTCAIVISDSEETLMLAEESRSKMLLKQQDPMVLEKKVNTKLVDYAVLNQLSQDFEKQFVQQTELSAEQAFWSQNSMNSSDPNPSIRPIKVEVPKEHPKVSKAMEQHRVESKTFKIKMNQALKENERLLEQVINKYIMNIVVNSSVDNASVRVKPSTSASGSQPSGNTKKNKIQRPPSSTQKNKVEAHLRNVKSSLKNKNCTVEPKGPATLQHSKLNANSKLICVKCNGCMLSDNHDLCVPNFISDVNARAKSKFFKKNSKRKVWKPTGKMFTKIGYIWRPTGQTFFIVGNMCPLTRITTTTEVPSRKPIALETDIHKPVVTLVYSRKPRKSKTTDHVRKSKVIKYVSANNKEPTRHGLVRGLPKLKFEKDHLCSACAMGKSKKKPHKPKSEDTNQEKLYLLHMDLYGLIRVISVNGKKYILVIVDDYSRFTWVKCLRSKDEAPYFIIKFLKMIQVRLKTLVHRIRTDNGTEFVNQTSCEYYEKVGISHETSVACSPQQNGVIERRNHTLIEVSRTMLIYAKALLFLWAEAVATTCYTQSRSIIRLRHGKTLYEILHVKLLELSIFHVFGALCYPIIDSENLGKLQPKADIDFDELTAMDSDHSSLEPALHEMTPTTISSGLMSNPPPLTLFMPPSRTD